ALWRALDREPDDTRGLLLCRGVRGVRAPGAERPRAARTRPRRDSRYVARPALSAISRADGLGWADRSQGRVSRGRQPAARAVGARMRARVTRRAAHGEMPLEGSRRGTAPEHGARDARSDSVVEPILGRPSSDRAHDRRAELRARGGDLRSAAARPLLCRVTRGAARAATAQRQPAPDG